MIPGIYNIGKFSLLSTTMDVGQVNTTLERSVSRFYWVFILAIAVMVIMLLVQQSKLRKINRRRKFLENLSKGHGPLAHKNILKTLINSLPDFIYVKDKDSKFIIANSKLAHTVNQESGEDLVGKSDYNYYPKKLADFFRKTEIDVITTGKAVLNQTEKGLDEKKNDIWVSTSKVPIKDEYGNVVGIVGIGRDITLAKQYEEKLKKQSEELLEVNTLLEERQEEILQQKEELKTQTEKLEEDKKLLYNLINNMPDRIYIKDRESRFIVGNIHVCRVMGIANPEEVTGKTDYDYYPKELAEEYFRDEQEIMASGKSIINKEERGYDLNQDEIIVSTTKVPVRNEDGEIIGIVGIGRDITAQKETEIRLKKQSSELQEANVLLEERQEEIQQQSEELQTQAEHLLKVNQELEKLSLVASRTDNVIIIMDADGNFEWVNNGFVKRYGMNLAEFTEKRGKNLTESSSYEGISETIEQIKREKKPLIYNSRNTDVNGKVIWSQTTISPVMDENGDITRIIAIDSDISRLKEAEEQIQEQTDELRKLNATKDKFFSIIAHDLKNPFHSIMGFSDLLTRSYDSIEEDKKKEFIGLIKDSSTSAYSLLENLLHWARTQTNRIKFNPAKIDLNVVIEENIAMLMVNAENKNISLHKPEERNLFAFADYNMVNTIFRNLMSNALKFTPAGGMVTISSEQKDGRVYLSVTDTGIGMSDEEISKLFKLDEFHTTTGTSGESGTGLGLIVCREFVLKHGGDIDVKSTPGQGSSFTFSLPLENQEN